MHTPITEKQILQLEYGDPLLIHGAFIRTYSDGDMGIKVKVTNGHTGKPQDQLICVSATCVSILSEPPTSVGSQPKYDPCRKFKNGDVAKPRIVDGRKGFHFNDGDILKVYKDEDQFNRVSVQNQDGVCICTNACYLELVTPVEELKPYSVVELSNGDYAVYKRDELLCVFRDGELVTPVEEIKPYSVTYDNKFYHINKHGEEASIAVYSEARHPDAKSAAEAERDRLNAEHRKEQK